MKKLLLVYLTGFIAIHAFTQANVGIGTITPSERLHVTQTADANKNVIYGYASQNATQNDYQNTGVAGFGEGNANGYGFGVGVKGVGNTNGFGGVGVYAALSTSIPILNLSNTYSALYADVLTPSSNRYAGVFMNGNVGIGTATPAYVLDVAGRMRLRNSSGLSAGLWFNKNDNSNTAGFMGTYDNDNYIGMFGNNGAGWSFLMNTANGNVGIGTATPLQKIDVNGRMNITNGVIQRGGTAITATSDLGLYSRVSGNYIRFVTNAAPIRFFSDDNIGTNANMTIEANGNVGIGNSSPQAQLEVSNFTKLGSDAPKIKMKKITGTTSGSDGGSVTISHGLDVNKILAVDVLIQSGSGDYIHPGYTRYPGYQINFELYLTDIYIQNIPFNSGSILSKPIRILITYEE